MIRQRQLPPDDVCVSAKLALPEVMTDDDPGRRTTALIVSVREDATACCVHSERVEEVAADVKHARATHFATGSEVRCVSAPREDSGKGLLPIANLFPDWKGHRRLPPDSAARAFHVGHAN